MTLHSRRTLILEKTKLLLGKPLKFGIEYEEQFAMLQCFIEELFIVLAIFVLFSQSSYTFDNEETACIVNIRKHSIFAGNHRYREVNNQLQCQQGIKICF